MQLTTYLTHRNKRRVAQNETEECVLNKWTRQKATKRAKQDEDEQSDIDFKVMSIEKWMNLMRRPKRDRNYKNEPVRDTE